MNKTLKMYAFAALAVIQLSVAANMIIQNEHLFATGKVFKFRCMPVDPYDAFRGRYVAIGVDRNSISYAAGNMPDFMQNQMVYGLLSTDTGGFSHIAELSADKPRKGDYVKLRISYLSNYNNTVYFQFPIDRYYMNEEAAPKAESAYWSTWRTRQVAYMEVFIKEGEAVMKGLYIDGVPIEEVIKK